MTFQARHILQRFSRRLVDHLARLTGISRRRGVTLVTFRSLGPLVASLVPFVGLSASPAAAQVAPLPLPAPVAAPALPPLFQPFRIDRSNRVAVQVRLNGTGPYFFIVDTGSERSIISNELARQLLLEPGPELGLATIAGRHIAPSYYVDRLQTDSFALDDLEAPALERRNLGAQGLIGLDGLNGHRVVMDFANDRMSVEKTGRKLRSGVEPDGTIVVNAQRLRGRMVIHQATINGITVDLVLDTGTQTTIGNLALRDKLLGKRSTKSATGFIESVTGDRIKSTIALADEIRIGDATVVDLPISFADAYAFQVLGLHEKPALLLGMDVIGLFDRVTIDFDKRQVQFGIPGEQHRDRFAGVNLPVPPRDLR